MAIFGRAFPIRPWIGKPLSAAGAATYNVSVTESASATEALDAAAVFANSFAEAGAATDTDSSLAVFGSSITETGAANDTGSALGTFGTSIVEAASATDTESATGGTAGVRVGGGGRGKRYFERRPYDPWAQTLSRKRWEELQALLLAERSAADRADELPRPKARKALNAAADAAREAAEAIEAQQAEFAEVARLTAALNAAAKAKTTAAIIRECNLANDYAKAIIADIEDDEEAIALLLAA